MTSTNNATSSSHPSRRGRRWPPVKNVDISCTTSDAGSSSAAQWWVCRSSSPAVTSKEIVIVESKASDTGAPTSGP